MLEIRDKLPSFLSKAGLDTSIPTDCINKNSLRSSITVKKVLSSLSCRQHASPTKVSTKQIISSFPLFSLTPLQTKGHVKYLLYSSKIQPRFLSYDKCNNKQRKRIMSNTFENLTPMIKPNFGRVQSQTLARCSLSDDFGKDGNTSLNLLITINVCKQRENDFMSKIFDESELISIIKTKSRLKSNQVALIVCNIFYSNPKEALIEYVVGTKNSRIVRKKYCWRIYLMSAELNGTPCIIVGVENYKRNKLLYVNVARFKLHELIRHV
ncbi:hypothetical protein V1477_011544 [Vespula maculifrons]|uniref:Uncharacterized protein n=1 Tax=Vespula maculifrons TaxID=7453 RepID=A0ABD2BZI0_VESMC